MIKVKMVATKAMVLALAFGFVGCTQKKDAAFSPTDSNVADIIAISELNRKEFVLNTGEVDQASVSADNLGKAVNEKPQAKITSSNLPGRLATAFSQLSVTAQAESEVRLYTEMNVKRKVINVYRVVDGLEGLTKLEKSLLISRDGKDLVVFAQIPVLEMGIIERAKNANGESTAVLELVPTDAARATHVRIDSKSQSISQISEAEFDDVYLTQAVTDKVMEMGDLAEMIDLRINLAQKSDRVIAFLDSSVKADRLLVFEILQRKDVKNEALLRQLDGVIKSAQIQECTEEVLVQIPESERAQCVMVLKYELPAETVAIKVNPADSDRSFFETEVGTMSARKSNLLRVKAGTAAQPIQVSDMSDLLPSNTLRMSDIEGKEFLFRRTFEDSSATMLDGPGVSGELVITEFVTEPNRLVVRRADVLDGSKSATVIDKEELLSVPVRYFKHDISAGAVQKGIVSANNQDAEYIVVDWTRSSIQFSISPLQYFGKQCFESAANKTIEPATINNRMSEGVLSFSMTGSYNLADNCASEFSKIDYFWENGSYQTNFTVKERLSFRVHNQKLDKNIVDLPYQAQRLMGFGAFTTSRLTPDKFGQTGTIGSQLSMPITHDFTNGKQLVYHLGGLEEKGEMREAIIEVTRKVIADWDAAVRKAFAGTPLERSAPYVVLKIDGIDAVPGRLGDLDRNYIWDFNKGLNSGALGIAQVGPNSRSGKTEQANVLMFSGNLKGQIAYFMEVARLRAQYEALRKAAGESLMAERNKSKTEKVLNPSLVDELLNKVKGLFGEKKSSRILGQAKDQVQAQDMKFYQQEIARLRSRVSPEKVKALNELSKRDPTLTMFAEARQKRITQDPHALEALFSQRMLEADASGVRPLNFIQRQSLKEGGMRASLMAELKNNLAKGPNCVFTMPESNIPLDTTKPFIEIFKNAFANTLAHEIGHAMGLTHNFQGSVDKANFEFQGEKTGRTYSSVMDYIPDNVSVYKGIGPYDVRTMRVLYTGLIELSEQAQAAAARNKGQFVATNMDGKRVGAKLNARGEVSLTEYKGLTVGSQSWWMLTRGAMSAVPLKKYKYCNDYEVGWELDCNRWDLGTNSAEITQHYVNEYRDRYVINGHQGNRLRAASDGAYAARVYMTLDSIKNQKDELFYGAYLRTLDPAGINALFSASKNGLELFVQIASQPTATKTFFDPSRFSLVDYQVTKKNDKGADVTESKIGLVEARPLQSLYDTESGILLGRGIEMEKAIALEMLLSIEPSNWKIAGQSIRFSYVDFENQAFNLKSEDTLSLTILREGLLDRSNARMRTQEGLLLNLPPEVASEKNEWVRLYLAASGVLFQERGSADLEYNNGALAQVGSSRLYERNLGQVGQWEANLTLSNTLKYFAPAGASIADEMSLMARGHRVLDRNSAMLEKAMSEALVAKNPEIVVNALEKAQILAFVAPNREAALEQAKVALDVYSILLTNLNGLTKPDQLDPMQPENMRIRNQLADLGKKSPLVAAAQKLALDTAMKDLKKKDVADNLFAISNPTLPKDHHNTLLGNMKLLNLFTGMVSPGLSQ